MCRGVRSSSSRDEFVDYADIPDILKVQEIHEEGLPILSRSAAGKYQLPYNTHKAGTADHPPPLSTPLVCAMNVMWLPVLAGVCSLLPGQIFVKCRKCDGVTVSISLPLYRSIIHFIHLPNIYLPPPSLLPSPPATLSTPSAENWSHDVSWPDPSYQMASISLMEMAALEHFPIISWFSSSTSQWFN